MSVLHLPYVRRLLDFFSSLRHYKEIGRIRVDPGFASTPTTQQYASQGLEPSEKDQMFWQQATGLPLARMLQEANYSFESQQSTFQFHSSQIIPRLGPQPVGKENSVKWKSFVTDGLFPLEYSWSWNKGSSDLPKVRYTVELIGSDAGSTIDPYNQFSGLDAACGIVSRYPNVDLTWLIHFSNAVIGNGSGLASGTSTYNGASQSSIFLAFDFHHAGGLSMKAYLIPVKAEKIGLSRLEVVSQAIYNLQQQSMARFPAYDLLVKYLSTHSSSHSISVVGLGVDCVRPEKARLRLYVRGSQTSFDSVSEMLSLNGRLPTMESKRTVSNVRKLWDLLLSTSPELPSHVNLPESDHETGGVLYSFDIKPANQLPEAKLYIPVKHYAQNDGTAAEGFDTFMREQGRHQWIEGFGKVLEQIGGEGWRERRGMLTYVGVGLEREELSLTSYLAPRFQSSN